jgi:hypothetical protein
MKDDHMNTSLSSDPQEPLSIQAMVKNAQGTAFVFPRTLNFSKTEKNNRPHNVKEYPRMLTIVRPPEPQPLAGPEPRRNKVTALLKTFGNSVQGSVNYIIDGFWKEPMPSKAKISGSANSTNPGIVEKSRFINERVSVAVNRVSFTPKQVEALKKSLNRL